MTITSQQLLALLPILIVGLTVVAVMLAIAWKRCHKMSATLAIGGLTAALLSLFMVGQQTPIQATPLLEIDGFACFYMALVLIASIVTCIFAYPWLKGYPDNGEEFYLLIVIATLGGIMLTSAAHLASLFIGIELLSLPLFGLIGYAYRRKRSLEAAIKYMVLSAVASSFLIFGMALLYAVSGALSFSALGDAINGHLLSQPLLLAAFGLLLVGFGFKLSLVPFQLWTPDVYEGAPAPVATYLATVGKIAVFAALTRLFLTAPVADSEAIRLVLGAFAFCSIIFGNALALRQSNLKRILGYSSIAHLGYLLIALIALRNSELAFETIAVYLVGYLFSSLGAFGVVCLGSSPYAAEDRDTVVSYRGLFWQKPVLAISLSVMMLSFAGIPLTLGFIGKFYLLAAGVMSSQWWLVATVVVGSAMGLYYYLRVAVIIFYHDDEGHTAASYSKDCNPLATGAIVVSGLIVLFFGIYPQPLIDLVQLAMPAL